MSIQAGALMILFLTPIILPVRPYGFEQVKVIFFVIFASLLAIAWQIKAKKIKFGSPIFLSSSTFLVILFLTSLGGVSLDDSLIGRPPYFQGLIIYTVLFLWFLLVSNIKLKFLHLAWTLTLSAVVVALFALYQWVGIHLFDLTFLNYADRVIATFGQPNFFSGYLVLTLPFAYILYVKRDLKILYALFISIISIGILISESRAAIAIMVGYILIILFKALRPKTRSTMIVVAAVTLIAASSFSYIQQTGIIFNEIIQPYDKQWLRDHSPEKRILIYSIMSEVFKRSVLLGYGLENIDQALKNYITTVRVEELLDPTFHSLKNVVIDRTHSYFLDLLIFSGISGLVSYLILIFYLLKTKNKVLLVCLISYLIWVQFQNQSIVHLIYFWTIAGMINRELIDSIKH